MTRSAVFTSLFLLFVLVRPATGQDFSGVEITVVPVAGNVYMLEGAGGNIGVSAGPDGILLVDDQFAPLADKIRAALRQLSPGGPRFILNTHWHGDHTGGNAVFGPEAPIISHSNVRARLMTDQTVRGREVPAAPAEAWPVVTFDHSLSLHFNGEEIKALHFPHAHTDGDAVILFTGANVIHMGDTFWSGRFPFVDLESGGSVAGLIRTVAAILDSAPPGARFIPGHGSVSTAAEVAEFHRMLVETSAFVRVGLEAGKSLEDIEAEGLPEEWKEWGTGFIDEAAWIETIARSPAD